MRIVAFCLCVIVFDLAGCSHSEMQALCHLVVRFVTTATKLMKATVSPVSVILLKTDSSYIRIVILVKSTSWHIGNKNLSFLSRVDNKYVAFLSMFYTRFL